MIQAWPLRAPGENPEETVCLELNLNVVAAPSGLCDLKVPALGSSHAGSRAAAPGTCTTFPNLHRQPSGAPNKTLSFLSSPESVFAVAKPPDKHTTSRAVVGLHGMMQRAVCSLVAPHTVVRTMQLRLRSKLHSCDLTDLHNHGWATAENGILIGPVRQLGPREGQCLAQDYMAT